MNVKIEESWRRRLQPEFDKPYFGLLADFVRKEYSAGKVYPPAKLIFNAFDSCPFEKVKVVIIGQDPYHEPGQAHGLCFSVNPGVPFPPSLKNIFKEISNDLAIPEPADGNLERWAYRAIHLLNDEREHLVFMLWGAYAQRKGEFIDRDKHLVLASPHPSPLSAHRGFFGNRHFSRANEYLVQHGLAPIKW